MKADARTEAAVMRALKRNIDAYAQRDIKAALATFVPDPDLVILGTGPDEKTVGLDELQKGLERDFAQSQAATWEFGRRTVSTEGSVAWVTADATIHARVGRKKITMSPLRYTVVLVHRGRKWLIAQSHLSMPYVGQQVGQSWPTK